MAITIIVETGAVATGANSFVSLADFNIYCVDRDYDVSNSPDETIKAALVRAASYLNTLPWKGVKTARANPMCWPRYGMDTSGWNEINQPASSWLGVLDAEGYYIGTSEVPGEVVNAQCEATYLILLGKDMEPTLDRGGQVKREKYDVVEFEYFAGASPTTEFKAVTNRLRGLLKGIDTRELVRS